jgi:hypothetical protein
MLEFKNETPETVLEIFNDVESQISEIGSLKYLCEDVTLEISYSYHPVMLDGKVYTIVTKTGSYAVCHCCGASPNEMSDPKNLKNDRFKKTHEKFKKQNLRFNLQPMHTTTNVVNMLYEISFRKTIKVHWKKLTKEEEDLMKKEKQKVKKAMWENFHVRIKEVRQGGIGTSDTAKNARKVLSEPVLLAQTLGLNEELVIRISNILTQIRSYDPVNSLDEFENYCKDTYAMFLSLYDWYKIPVTLHRVLAHGRDYMEALPLPLGRLSEEAGESQNKLLRNDREFLARKTSRIDNLTDVIHRRYITSDPVIHKKYMDIIDKKSKKGNAPENEVPHHENEENQFSEDIEIFELTEPEGEGYDYPEEPENYSEN